MISPSREEVREDPASLIVFGDLALSFEEDLRSLLHAREDEALQSFLDRVANALRHDLSYQPAAVQNLFPRFVSIIDILSKLGETEGTPVLRFFLLTVCQISQFIQYVARLATFAPVLTDEAASSVQGRFQQPTMHTLWEYVPVLSPPQLSVYHTQWRMSSSQVLKPRELRSALPSSLFLPKMKSRGH
jgi:hypothetical protein